MTEITFEELPEITFEDLPQQESPQEQTEVFVCANCGEEFDFGDELIKTPDHDLFCSDCFVENFSFCDYCGSVCHRDDLSYSELQDRHYCDSCFTDRVPHCYSCGCELHPENHHTDGADLVFCSDCFFEDYFVCDDCGEVCSREYEHYDEHDGCSYCDGCYRPNSSEHIADYTYKPNPEFKSNSKKERTNGKTLFFGLELEVENRKCDYSNDEVAGQVNSYLPDVYCKEDGSLNNGFEIVTHPFTWEWYKAHKKDFDALLDFLIKKGFSSFDPGTCGIHIHMSKNAFSTLQLYKLLKLFYEYENYPHIKAISQRTDKSSRGSCQWGYSPETMDHCQCIYNAKEKYNDRRYTAVNLSNSHTIEIRIFRGTLNKVSFHKNLEFVKAVYHYTNVTSIKNINWKSLSRYIIEHKKSFPNLYEFMNKKELFHKDYNVINKIIS